MTTFEIFILSLNLAIAKRYIWETIRAINPVLENVKIKVTIDKINNGIMKNNPLLFNYVVIRQY